MRQAARNLTDFTDFKSGRFCFYLLVAILSYVISAMFHSFTFKNKLLT